MVAITTTTTTTATAPYEDDFGSNPQTLCDWVKNFRLKRFQMKRKLRTGNGDYLRVYSIMSTALLSAEHELRRKQHERFSRWQMTMQRRLETKYEQSTESKSSNSFVDVIDDGDSDYIKPNDLAEELKKREEISNLWKYELSGLDAFMRTISGSNTNNRSSNNSLGGPMDDDDEDDIEDGGSTNTNTNTSPSDSPIHTNSISSSSSESSSGGIRVAS